MKTLIFSDLHSHNYREFSEINERGINSRLHDCTEVLYEIDKFCTKEEIKHIIFAGDIFHLKNNLDSRVIKKTMDALGQLCMDRESVFLPGNHDYRLWSGEPVLLELFEDYAHELKIHIIKTPKFVDAIWYEPYTRQIEELNERIKKLDSVKHIFVGHQDIIGTYYGGHKVTKGLDPKILEDKFSWSFVGHYHVPNHQPGTGLVSIGAPLQHNFGDAFQERGWWVYDDEEDEIKFYQNTFSPRFFDIKASDESIEIPGDPNKDFYRITVAGHELPELYHGIRWKRIIFRTETDKKSRSTISFSDKSEDLITKYVDLRPHEGLDREKLITFGRKYL